jgi:hypothetical protein
MRRSMIDSNRREKFINAPKCRKLIAAEAYMMIAGTAERNNVSLYHNF